jgi:hypothetical protein
LESFIMNRSAQILVVSLLLLVGGVIPALAHHGYAAYDETVTQSLKGTVTDFELENPHSTMSFDVKGGDGKVENWTAEAGHVRLMQANGWKSDTLKEGDVATFYFHPAKNGAHAVDLVKVVLSDGKTLMAHSSGEGAAVQ